MAHPRAGDGVVVAPPVRLDGSPLAYGTAAPVLGADTLAVLGQLGLSGPQIAHLVADGAVVAG